MSASQVLPDTAQRVAGLLVSIGHDKPENPATFFNVVPAQEAVAKK